MDFFIIYYLVFFIYLVLASTTQMDKLAIKILVIIGNIPLCLLLDKNSILEVTLIGLILLITIYTLIIRLEAIELILYQLTIIGISALMTTNLLQMFLALEIINFCAITLIPILTRSLYSLESSLKYFLISTISAASFILGTALIYGETGSIDLYFNFTIESSNLIIGLLLILVSLFIKLAIAPFHFWLPDAYEGTNYKTFIFIALFPKLFILLILYFFYKMMEPLNNNFFALILFLGIIFSGWIGGIQAIFQEKIKRFFSFTMIFNNAFLLIPILATNVFFLICSFTLYLINQLFTILILMKHSIKNVNQLPIMDQLSKQIFAFSLFSALGVPPLVGFFVKLLPFFILSTGSGKNIYLVSFLIILSVLAAFYYLRLIGISVNFFFPQKFFLTRQSDTYPMTNTDVACINWAICISLLTLFQILLILIIFF